MMRGDVCENDTVTFGKGKGKWEHRDNKRRLLMVFYGFSWVRKCSVIHQSVQIQKGV